MADLVAKFHVSTVKGVKNQGVGGWSSEEITAHAVYGGSEENKQWSKYTPAGNLTLQFTNESIFGLLNPGDEILIEISKIVKSANTI